MQSLNSEDRGATALFLAVVLMLLLGVAAVAVDLAQGWNERRQDQTAVDVAAVAGALSFNTNQTTIANQVMATARENLDTAYTNTEWNDLWTACAGPPPSGFVPINHSSLGTIPCIGINPSFLWVRLPEQIVETSFGKVLGVDQLSTGAEAIVTLLGSSGGGALPFAIRGNAGSGEVCLDTGPNPEEPCDGNESGSFGNIAPPLFGNEILNTTPSCGNQSSANNYVPESIAMGIDHILWNFSQADWAASGWDPNDATGNNTVRNDPNTQLDECIDTGGPVAQPKDGIPINTVYVDTGNNTKADITEGLVTGVNFPDGDDARLTRSTNTRNVKGYELDNNALWSYLMPYDPSGTSGHTVAVCDGPTIRALPDIDAKNDAMRLCLEGYPTSGGPQIFTDGIMSTPRLGVAPRLWHNNFGNGITFRPIKSFDLVFIHGVWFKQGGSAVPFFPDDGTAPFTAGSFPVEQVTAHLLLDSMVSEEVHTALGGFSNDTWQPEIYQ